MFDLDKFKAGQLAVTRDGKVAAFVAYVAEARSHRVVAVANGIIRVYNDDGRQWHTSDMPEDLIAMKPRVVVLWVNRYTCGACAAYRSEMDADDGAGEAALERIGGKALRIEIPMED